MPLGQGAAHAAASVMSRNEGEHSPLYERLPFAKGFRVL